jgi:hypothetical protein
LACPLCRAERSADFGGRLVGFGDDLAVKADGFLVADPGPAWMLSRLGAGRPLLERARLGVAFVGAVRRGPSSTRCRTGWPPTGWRGGWAWATTCGGACGTATSVGMGRGPSVRGGRDPLAVLLEELLPAPGARPAGAGCTSGPRREAFGGRWRVGSHASPSHVPPSLNQPCRTEASYHGRGRSPVCRSHGLGKGRASVGRWLRFQGGLTVRSGP